MNIHSIQDCYNYCVDVNTGSDLFPFVVVELQNYMPQCAVILHNL